MLRVLLAIDDYGEMVYLQTLLKKLGFDVDAVQKQRAFAGKQLGFNPQIVLATADGRRVNGIELAEGIRRRQGIPHFILLVHPQQAKELDLDNLKNVDGHLESPVNIQRLLEIISLVADVDAVALLEKYNRMRASLQPDETGDLTILKGDTGPIERDPDPTMPAGSTPAPQMEVPEDQAKAAAPEASPESPSEPSFETPEAKPADLDQSLAEELEDLGEATFETGAEVPPVGKGMPSEVREARFRKYLDELPEPEVDGFSRDKVIKENKELRRSEDQEGLKDLEEERQGFVKTLFSEGKKGKKPS